MEVGYSSAEDERVSVAFEGATFCLSLRYIVQTP